MARGRPKKEFDQKAFNDLIGLGCTEEEICWFFRDEMGCGACDLVQKDVDIIEAYDMAIRALKEEMICPILSDDEVKQPCIKSPCGIERPHGDWKDCNGNIVYPFWKRYECSECGARSDNTNFCPNCGADMRKEGESE